MLLQPAICTQCGSKLKVNSEKDTAICEYCGTPFIDKKAISFFSSDQSNRNDSDFQIEAGILLKYTGQSLDVVIPEGVLEIRGAFSGCSYIKSIKLPKSLKSIGVDAFKDCKGIISIEIPQGVTEVKDGAFQNCISLRNINFPYGITYIGAGALMDCKSLTSITIPKSVKSIDGAFYKGAFQNCVSLREVNLPSSLIEVGHYAFSGCTGMRRVTFPNSVNRIGRAVISGCTAIKEVVLPNSYFKIISLNLNFNTFLNSNMYEYTFGQETYCLSSVLLHDGTQRIGTLAYSDGEFYFRTTEMRWKKEHMPLRVRNCPLCGYGKISLISGKCNSCGCKHTSI